jgi:hypothetical protein
MNVCSNIDRTITALQTFSYIRANIIHQPKHIGETPVGAASGIIFFDSPFVIPPASLSAELKRIFIYAFQRGTRRLEDHVSELKNLIPAIIVRTLQILKRHLLQIKKEN